MKKVMMAALALTLVGGAAFAQKSTKATTTAPKQEMKQEAKADEAKAPVKKKKVAKVKKAETAKPEEAAK